MIPLRIVLAGAAAALALGGGTAFAAPALMASVSHHNGDSQGDAVSAHADSCAHGTASNRDAHGDCVSEAAEKSGTSGSHGQSGTHSGSGSNANDAHGDAVSAAAKSCAHGTASDRDAHGECVSATADKNGTAHGGH